MGDVFIDADATRQQLGALGQEVRAQLKVHGAEHPGAVVQAAGRDFATLGAKLTEAYDRLYRAQAMQYATLADGVAAANAEVRTFEQSDETHGAQLRQVVQP